MTDARGRRLTQQRGEGVVVTLDTVRSPGAKDERQVCFAGPHRHREPAGAVASASRVRRSRSA